MIYIQRETQYAAIWLPYSICMDMLWGYCCSLYSSRADNTFQMVRVCVSGKHDVLFYGRGLLSGAQDKIVLVKDLNCKSFLGKWEIQGNCSWWEMNSGVVSEWTNNKDFLELVLIKNLIGGASLLVKEFQLLFKFIVQHFQATK